MGIYLSTPKTDKLSENGENDRLKFGLSSMQGWRASMEDAHSALLNLDSETAFFGVFDGHGGRVVAKFCAKYLHSQVLKSEAYSAGDLGTAAHRAFFRMDEMMRGQRGWRELSALGDKINKFSGMIEGLIWSPRGSDSNNQQDDWALEEVHMQLATAAFTFQMCIWFPFLLKYRFYVFQILKILVSFVNCTNNSFRLESETHAMRTIATQK